MIDPSEMIEVAVLDKRGAVQVVHDEVQCEEGEQAVDRECYSLCVEKSQHLSSWRRRHFRVLGRCCWSFVFKPPYY